MHHQGVGYHDTIDMAALAERRIPLAITPGGTTIGVAEHAVMLILAVLRRLPFADAELRQGRWHINALRPVSRGAARPHGRLLGTGRIGRAVAERLRPFGMTALYFDPAGACRRTSSARSGLERAQLRGAARARRHRHACTCR